MLTRKQYELLVYIDNYLRDRGISPSFDEMKEALDLKSKSGIHRLITGLEERGFIRRLAHRARALEVLRLPENSDDDAPETPNNVTSLASARKTPHRPTTVPTAFSDNSDAISLPLYGRIAAGTPIEALRDQSTMVQVPAALLGAGDHYALEVSGDSMIEAGILDGDTVLIQRCEQAHDGTIVVALVDDSEATLKRLKRGRGEVMLEPANARYETRSLSPDRVRIQGRLVGLLRQY
ncbi:MULTISPECIES: transcriptional repressor LexA [Thalassospira]|uniref:LexA repressor n=3 Tax=Thalassospira TaxID=168934 RepID=A0A358HSK5_9PROT|nr:MULTISPECIES: transcriptional repressor LexA [Thalassospira]PKR59563.1 transcriptional repressor LexA [Thalassospira lohafexi]RCK26282.1 LexA family transcriptional regulator [Thalassospira lucentensis MCCC 1A00383 = DSM 14000]HBU98166.1 transcriptional repressor LexA [Thalassospira lucentensis]|tara:strand:- start:118325 stop:119032 length:708 start_codon:yes stop_codon:yes gene_type:complete